MVDKWSPSWTKAFYEEIEKELFLMFKNDYEKNEKK
jgi:hypothetical protein